MSFSTASQARKLSGLWRGRRFIARARRTKAPNSACRFIKGCDFADVGVHDRREIKLSDARPAFHDDRLTAAVQAGQITEDTTEIFGWRDGRRPDNADAFVKSEEAKANWANTHLTFAVRVDPRDDGMRRIDSNLRKLMGLLDS